MIVYDFKGNVSRGRGGVHFECYGFTGSSSLTLSTNYIFRRTLVPDWAVLGAFKVLLSEAIKFI